MRKWMKKRISLYLGLKTIAQLKNLSEESKPHASQSAIVADLINNKSLEEKLETNSEKRNKKTS
jgi:hypothetical protein